MEFLRLDYSQFLPYLASLDLKEGSVLCVDKPYKVTSFEVVNKIKIAIRKTFSEKVKVGHAGTLDPLATGLLVICTGKKTKTIEQIQALEKTYTGTFVLGATTPCFDLEREIDAHFPYGHITEEMARETAARFVGRQQQTPPVFSAVKVDGKRAYELARGGEADIAVRPKEIEIKEFEITRFALPEIGFRVVCSKGTYIRSLARDFGLALQSGAHLMELRRTAIGPYKVETAIPATTPKP